MGAPLVLHDGDSLWKCWVTNVHRGVQVQVLSARRADGTFSVAIIFIREQEGDQATARFWVKNDLDEVRVVDAANDIMKSVGDDRLHFRLIDLSDLRDQGKQMERLAEEGFETLTIHRTDRRPEEN